MSKKPEIVVTTKINRSSMDITINVGKKTKTVTVETDCLDLNNYSKLLQWFTCVKEFKFFGDVNLTGQFTHEFVSPLEIPYKEPSFEDFEDVYMVVEDYTNEAAYEKMYAGNDFRLEVVIPNLLMFMGIKEYSLKFA